MTSHINTQTKLSSFDFGGFDFGEAVEEVSDHRTHLDMALTEAVDLIILNKHEVSSIVSGFAHLFSSMHSSIHELSLKKVADSLEVLMKEVENIDLNTECKLLIVSNLIEINVKLNATLSMSQIERYPEQQEWTIYFNRLNKIFNLENMEWQELCFAYLRPRTESDFYTFNQFVKDLDVLTFIVVSGNETAVWADYQKYFDNLMEEFVGRFLGTQFGDKAIKGYVQVEDGREVSCLMGNVIGKYLISPGLDMSEGFQLISTLHSNRTISKEAWYDIIVGFIFSNRKDGVYTIDEYDMLIDLFLKPPASEVRIYIWEKLEPLIISILQKRFVYSLNIIPSLNLESVLSEDVFLMWCSNLEERMHLWSHFERLDSSIKSNRRNYIRFLLCIISEQFNRLNTAQTIKIFDIFLDFVEGWKLGDLAEKIFLANVIAAIDCEHQRIGVTSNIIVEYFENGRGLMKSWASLVFDFGGKIIENVFDKGRDPYPLIKSMARLLQIEENELLLKIAPGVVSVSSFLECCDRVFGEKSLSLSDLSIAESVLKPSSLTASIYTMSVYLDCVSLPSDWIVSQVENILDKALMKKHFAYEDLFQTLNLLFFMGSKGLQEPILLRCDSRIHQILERRFSLRELMTIRTIEGGKFEASCYHDLSILLDGVMTVYELDKRKLLPRIQYHWIQEGIYSLRLVRSSAEISLEATRKLLARRKCPKEDLVLMEELLSEYKERILQMIILSFNYLSLYSDEYKEKAHKLILPILNVAMYEIPLSKETCLVMTKGKLVLRKM